MRVDHADRAFSLVHAADTLETETAGDGLRRKLEALAKRLETVNGFAKGQLVKWKPGLKTGASRITGSRSS
jgi:hypothetical protein